MGLTAAGGSTQFWENLELLSSIEPPKCPQKNCWCWRQLAAFCPPAPFSAVLLISAEAIPTRPLRFPLSVWMLLSFAPLGQSEAKFIVLSTKEFVSSVPAAPQRHKIPWVGFLCLFYPAFLLADSAECPVSDSNECIEKNHGLIPPPSPWSKGLILKQNFSLSSSAPINKNKDTPKYKSRIIHKGFAWHTWFACGVTVFV